MKCRIPNINKRTKMPFRQVTNMAGRREHFQGRDVTTVGEIRGVKVSATSLVTSPQKQV